MKKATIITFLLLLFPLIGSGQDYQTLEYYYEPTHETVKRECYFCGKDIFEQVEIKNSGYSGSSMDFFYIPNDNWIIVTIDSMQVQYITVNYNLKVCKRCSDKYDKEITEIMSGTWNKLMKSIINEKTNINLKKYYDLVRNQKQIDQLEKKILESESKKKELENKIKSLKEK